MLLERFPELRSLDWFEVESLAQNIVTRACEELRVRPDNAFESRVEECCRTRDARLEALILKDGGEGLLNPLKDESARQEIYERLEAELSAKPWDEQFALSIELYELASREEGPPDPAVLAMLNQRLAEYEANPELGCTWEELKERLAKIASEIKARKSAP